MPGYFRIPSWSLSHVAVLKCSGAAQFKPDFGLSGAHARWLFSRARIILSCPGGHVRKLSAVILFFACATLALAQTAAPAAKAAAAPVKDPVATSARFLLQRSEGNTVGAVEAMPADKFS